MFELTEHFFLTICAPRRSGKSFLIKHMLHKLLEDFDFIKIYCPSINFNDDYDEFQDEKKVELVSNPTKSMISKVIDEHEACSKMVKKNEDMECPRTLIILDDMIDSGILNFKGIIDRIAERGRHIKISAIVSSQRQSAISRSVRLNSDYFLIFAPAAVAELQKFLEEFIYRQQRRSLMDSLEQIFQIPYMFLIVDALDKEWGSKLKYTNTQHFMKNEYKVLKLCADVGTKKRERESSPNDDIQTKKRKREKSP